MWEPERFYSSKGKPHIYYNKKETNAIRESVNSRNFNLDLLKFSSSKRIVGIDLAGVVNKSSKTGICLLTDKYATTSVVKYDDDIIEYIVNSRADIVSLMRHFHYPLAEHLFIMMTPCAKKRES